MDVVMLLPHVFKLDQWRGDKAARVNKETFIANRRPLIWEIEPSSALSSLLACISGGVMLEECREGVWLREDVAGCLILSKKGNREEVT
jgi:hypothetical protein